MRIEYEDKEIIVVYKEAGLPVQSGRTSAKDLVSLLKNHLARCAGQGSGEPYLGIVHRLDQPVEGLLVFAKTPKAAANLSRQAAAKGTFGAGKQAGEDSEGASGMEKIYQAVCELSPEAFPLALEGRKRDITLTDWILRDHTGNTSLIVEEGVRDAKRAKLTFRTLEIRDARALVEIRLHTGRHHQIRVQMAHAGMPLAGDRKYGREAGGPGYAAPDGHPKNEAAPLAGENARTATPGQLCLCAQRLSFLHPAAGKRMTFKITPGFSL